MGAGAVAAVVAAEDSLNTGASTSAVMPSSVIGQVRAVSVADACTAAKASAPKYRWVTAAGPPAGREAVGGPPSSSPTGRPSVKPGGRSSAPAGATSMTMAATSRQLVRRKRRVLRMRGEGRWHRPGRRCYPSAPGRFGHPHPPLCVAFRSRPPLQRPMPSLMLASAPLRRISSLLVAVLAIATAAVLPASAAVATPSSPSAVSTSPSATSDEAEFLRLLNDERVNGGLAALDSDSGLAPTSRAWSQHMSDVNVLEHDPNLASVAEMVEPAWRSVGENVGVGYTVQSLHDAFMASTGHRANIMKTTYNRVGIGVVVETSGKIWVTVRFLEGPDLTPTPPAPVVVPGVASSLVGDFDGDGFGDLLTYGPGTTTDELWFGEANKVMRKASVNVSGQYQPVAGDFDGNGLVEILWYAPGSSSDYVWEWNGSSFTSTPTSIIGTYVPLSGDFDGDGFGDLLWYAAGSPKDYYWYGSGTGGFTSVETAIIGSYLPVTGDLDGNAGDDIFWYAKGTPNDYIWYSTLARGGYTSVQTSVIGTYVPVTGDFDGNNTDDLFWYAAGAAKDYTWFTDTTKGHYISVERSVQGTYLPGASDTDADGADDVVWFGPNTAAGDPLWFGRVGSTVYDASTVHSG